MAHAGLIARGPADDDEPRGQEAVDEGWRLSRRLSRVDLQESRAAFARAVATDPGYAPAHAGYATALTLLAAVGVERPDQVLPEALTSPRRAVEVNPTYSMSWTTFGHATLHWERNWSEAERSIPARHRPRSP